MNNCNLIGRLVKDIELKATPTGKKVTSFTLAVKRNKEQADFIQCVAWEHTALFLSNYCKKGNRIGVSGSLQSRNYETQNGKQYVTEVLVNNIELLESRQEPKPQEVPQINDLAFGDDDLPF